MGSWLYDQADYVFGSGLGDNLSSWMTEILGRLGSVVNSVPSSITNLLMSMAASLLIIYFFMDLTNQASKDMFSLDKLIVAFIKLLVAFAIVINLKEITTWVVKIAEAMATFVQGEWGSGITPGGGGWDGSGKEAYDDYFNHFSKIFVIIPVFGGLIIPWLITWLCELMGKFIIASSAVMLTVKLIFAPIAVVQCFEDGTRSSGIRYIKGLFAEALSFSIIIVIIIVALNVGTTDVNTFTDLASNPEKLQEALSIGNIVNLLIPKLIIAGGMASGSKIAHEIMGA